MPLPLPPEGSGIGGAVLASTEQVRFPPPPPPLTDLVAFSTSLFWHFVLIGISPEFVSSFHMGWRGDIHAPGTLFARHLAHHPLWYRYAARLSAQGGAVSGALSWAALPDSAATPSVLA
jgi:hypothetical protein